MDTFLSSPPAAVRADLAALRASLDQSDIPPKTLDRNVLIGTWNIRGFGKVLESLPRTIFQVRGRQWQLDPDVATPL